MILTENQLDAWVSGNARDAQGLIVEAVYRLVAASAPRPNERRFPLGDSIEQHGPDGFLNVQFGLEPYVPDGRSFWEIGSGADAAAKASSDYRDLVKALPPEVRGGATFIFVTPRSGRTEWEHTWKLESQGAWLADRRERHDWADVRVLDGTRLVEWLHQFPAVELWLANRILGITPAQVENTDQRWRLLRSIGDPPPLAPGVFLVNRDGARAKLDEVLRGSSLRLKFETHFANQVADFVAAHVETLPEDERRDAAGRCLIVSGTDAWNSLVTLRDPHVLVAIEDVDLDGDVGTRLIQRARQGGHAVIFAGPPGGIPDPSAIILANPSAYQLQEALRTAGYGDERARTLVQRSGGNLSTLLRLLQNLSVLPEWAEGSPASDLAIAALLGSWNEGVAADVRIVEDVAGNSYGAWIDLIRDSWLRSGTPLTYADGVWRFRSRYEGWFALGPRLFDEHLDRLSAAASSVLGELDPALELPPDDRPFASIRGLSLQHSEPLRRGLAESLALLGSNPQALASINPNRATAIPVTVLRQLFAKADWRLWASLDRLLPELAEGSPEAFLDGIEEALRIVPCPIRTLFDQEGTGVLGRTYTSGLLWALETLAWNADYFVRVCVCLGRMAAIDPGGQWSNRPINSLTTIFLPWLPQTTAPLPRRVAALNALLNETPEVAWRLLLSLLPRAHQVSTGSRRPSWRSWIPENWSGQVSRGEYADQVRTYSTLTIRTAEGSIDRMTALVEQIDDLPSESREAIATHLENAGDRPEEERERLWKALMVVVSRHEAYPDAPWAMDRQAVERLRAVAGSIAPNQPSLRHRRLFTERAVDLLEKQGDYAAQHADLERRRDQAVAEIAANEGLPGIIGFAQRVETPWRVGLALGSSPISGADEDILPALLLPSKPVLLQFAGGYIWGRFTSSGWEWVDRLPFAGWSSAEVGLFLSYLPFQPETWDRASSLLSDGAHYWRQTSANPYGSKTTDFSVAVDALIEYGRPFAAIRCLYYMNHSGRRLDHARATTALLAGVSSREERDQMSSHEVLELVAALQKDDLADANAVMQIEWAYLPILDADRGASPVRLERRLAEEPQFYVWLVSSIFKPRDMADDPAEPLPAEQTANAYRLLTDWRIPPGLTSGGHFDGSALQTWLAAVANQAGAVGRRDVALTTAGQVLIYVPPDPDGLWIDRGAARALDADEAGPLRAGFMTAVTNSRGAHYVDPTGAPERELASKYRQQADDVEDAGFHRLAGTMRRIAAAYEREAADSTARRWSEDD